MIYDVRGFYQTSFTAVAKNLIDQRKVTPDEKEDIAFMERMNEEWAALPLETIKRYTAIELRFTSRAVAVLRDGFHRVMGIHLKSWSGAGSAAGAYSEDGAQRKSLSERHQDKEPFAVASRRTPCVFWWPHRDDEAGLPRKGRVAHI
jgi:hypothetical protein